MSALRLAAAAAVTLSMTAPAAAAIFTQSYAFQADSAGPTALHSGTFTIAYDDVAGTASLTAMDFTIGATQFSAANAASQFYPDPEVLVYGTSNFIGVAQGTDDFYFRFNRDLIEGLDFVYTQAGDAGLYGTTLRIAVVPEPATWGMMLLGFGFAGFGARSGRSRAMSRSAV